VAFIPLCLDHLRACYDEQHGDASNAFVYSRFLVPFLEGWGQHNLHAIYMDSDVLIRDDIYKLWALRNPRAAVQVVKHEYKTQHAQKYLGNPNLDMPRKNWSSVMLWNCRYLDNRKLTPEFVAQQPGSFLHRFEWLPDARIGELPAEWNHLCMEYSPRPDDDAKVFHYTIGTPCFGGRYAEQEGATEWRLTLQNALAPLGQGATDGA
jgi:lipopolysaccharide biosynthesis glycosyltransferase